MFYQDQLLNINLNNENRSFMTTFGQQNELVPRNILPSMSCRSLAYLLISAYRRYHVTLQSVLLKHRRIFVSGKSDSRNREMQASAISIHRRVARLLAAQGSSCFSYGKRSFLMETFLWKALGNTVGKHFLV